MSDGFFWKTASYFCEKCGLVPHLVMDSERVSHFLLKCVVCKSEKLARKGTFEGLDVRKDGKSEWWDT